MRNENILYAIMPRFAFRVYEWQWISPDVCRLHTDGGRKILRLETHLPTVEARGELLDQLAWQRFRRTPRHIRTIDSQPYVVVHSQICTVADDLAWRPVTVQKSDVQAASANLAALHKAMAEITLGTGIDRRQTQVSEQMRLGMQRLRKGYERCLTQGDTPFARLFLRHARAVIDRASRAATTSKLAGLQEREERIRQRPVLTLGGYDFAKIARTDLGHIATVDFGDVAYGDAETDLSLFCRGLFERGEKTSIPLALAEYERVQGVDKSRSQRVLGFIAFPFAVAALMEAYMQSKEKTEALWEEDLRRALAIDGGTK